MKHTLRGDLGVGIVLLGTLLVFVPNLTGYFLADDFVLLSWTHDTSPGDVAGFFDPNAPWFYRPGVKLIYWAGQSVFGLRAAPFHFLSIMLHGANGFLLYRFLARQAEGSTGRLMGLAAALIFLLNPHHAETVSWVAAIGDLVAGFCVLGALLLCLNYWERPRPLYLFLAPALLTVGLFTRETAIIFPALTVLAALLLHPPGKREPREHSSGRIGSWVRRLLTLGVTLLPVLFYLGVQWLGRGGSTLSRGGLAFRPLNLDSILLGVMDYVHGLVPGGSVLADQPLDTLRVLVFVEAALLLAIAAALWVLRWRVALFGLLWLIVTPLLFVFFNAPTDRYFYLPSIGYAILAGTLIGHLPLAAARWQIPAGPVRLTAALLALALLLPSALALAGKVRVWHEAGQASGGVYNDVREAVPQPESQAHFYFLDLPTFLNGVPTFQNALPQAIQLLYGDNTLAARSATCAELKSGDLRDPFYLFRFKGDGARQLTGAEECAP